MTDRRKNIEHLKETLKNLKKIPETKGEININPKGLLGLMILDIGDFKTLVKDLKLATRKEITSITKREDYSTETYSGYRYTVNGTGYVWVLKNDTTDTALLGFNTPQVYMKLRKEGYMDSYALGYDPLTKLRELPVEWIPESIDRIN